MNNGIHRREEYNGGNGNAGGSRVPPLTEAHIDTPTKKRKLDKEVRNLLFEGLKSAVRHCLLWSECKMCGNAL